MPPCVDLGAENQQAGRAGVACVADCGGDGGRGGGHAANAVLAQTTAPAVSAANHAAALDAFRQAHDLYEQEKYADANTQNNKALELDPGLKDALLLKRVLQSKLGETGTTTTGPGGNTPTGPAPKVKPLTAQQISMIRLQEISDADTQIRGRVSRKFLDEFWTTYVKTQPGQDLSVAAYNDFVNPSNFANQVRAIRNAGNPKFSENVEIQSDPADMVAFRTRVQPYVLANCATSACHGGDKAGNFHLLRTGGATPDAVAYTNFYIMSSYVTKDGGMVINRGEPDKSLFLQYGVPRNVAHFTHPGKAEVRPHFGDENAADYRMMADWVKTLAYPQPNYGIVYEIPGMSVTPAPAPTTAPKPGSGRGATTRGAGR